MTAPVTYTLHQNDTEPSSKARLGRVTTPHGSFDTPAFMPVGTAASIKGLLPDQVADAGAQCILSNTYHLLLRPGPDLVAQMGGLHPWMNWPGPILTDSGGYQVFSLTKTNQITDHGVTFQSHLDGATIELTPEHSISIQNRLGADIIMAFDECPPASHSDQPGYRDRVLTANDRTIAWLDRCIASHARPDEQALFGIVQGGVDLELRTQHAQAITERNLPGFAIGGVAVGEGPAQIRAVVEHTAPLLPPDKPRYLMGVGYERDIVAAVRAGVDMFDCVLPTRNGRNAVAFTPTGPIRLKNAQYADDPRPIDPTCDCPACSKPYSRSYLRHLFQAGEMLGPILTSLHNIRHFQRLMVDIRHAIAHNAWSAFAEAWPVADL
ncbi:MAG: tRNA guanosine(34) transglycosylase Tgt [Planctomycetota bacterium]